MSQGKAKDSGWGSDDEAAGLPAGEINEESETAVAPKNSVCKQAASAFELLQNSDDEAKPAGKGAVSFEALEDNASIADDADLGDTGQGSDIATDTDSDAGDQVSSQIVVLLNLRFTHITP